MKKEVIYNYLIKEYRSHKVGLDEFFKSIELDDIVIELDEDFCLSDLIEAIAMVRFTIENDITVVINLDKDTAISNQISINTVEIDDRGSLQHAVTFMTEVLK